jgi:hypothetical protein
LLAIIYAGLLWDPRPPHYHWPASASVLPWCASSQTRIRRGWSRECIHRASVLLGVAHIPLNLRALLERWRDEHSVTRPSGLDSARERPEPPAPKTGAETDGASSTSDQTQQTDRLPAT